MNLFIDSAQQLVLEANGITLRGGLPILNGVAVDVHAPVVRQDRAAISLMYKSITPLVHFGVECWREPENGIVRVRYWVEKLVSDFELDSFGIHFAEVRGARTFLRNGYFSWDGSEYIQAATPHSVTGIP